MAKSSHEPLRVGLLGAGKMARNHARVIGLLGPSAQIVGFADPALESRQAMAGIVPGAAAFEGTQDLLAHTAVDVVHVCTPPDSHVEAAAAALEAGAHVYVEKPFAPSEEEARHLLDLAGTRGLKVCAGHQLLYESPTLEALDYLGSLGQLVHIESYFSFRSVRRAPGGGAAQPAHFQLLDILPHPVYLLARFLTEHVEEAPELSAVDLGPNGTVHAVVRSGPIAANLIVTLEGRPVENYVRLVGTNGSILADYVRGTVQRAIGPGVSAIDKVLNPYRQARQLVFGTTGSLWRRFRNRGRSYPGLSDIISAFYDAIRSDKDSPVSADNIVTTTRICSSIGSQVLQPAGEEKSASTGHGHVVVTGGTGFLGSQVTEACVRQGLSVTAVSRSAVAPWARVEGARYLLADLASGELDVSAVSDADAIIHCAAATSGGWEAHQRDSIEATDRLLEAAAASGIRRVIHVSSLAVQASPQRGQPIAEKTPLMSDVRSRGPYAWGKAESERLARTRAQQLGIDLKVARPGALIDPDKFDPPGRLGRQIGNWFVAVGRPSDRLGVCEVGFAATVLTWMVEHWEDAPDTVNLLEPELPTKRQLVGALRHTQPDVTVLWLPRVLLTPLSLMFRGLQKLRSPTQPGVNVSRIFAREHYDTSLIKKIVPKTPSD